MLLQNLEDYLELTVIDRGTVGMPDYGDLGFSVRIRISGMNTFFAGETCCWIEFSKLVSFANELQSLEKHRRGSASIEAMSPDDFRLEVRIIDQVGHVAAIGQVGQWCSGGSQRTYFSSLAFDILFCPTELPALVREWTTLATLVER